MDRMQIALRIGLSALGIDLEEVDINRDYQKICNMVYLAEQRGVHISPSRILLDPSTGQAYSPMSHESGGQPSENLYSNLCEIREEIDSRKKYEGGDSRGWQLDESSIKNIEWLRQEIEETSLEILLEKESCVV